MPRPLPIDAAAAFRALLLCLALTACGQEGVSLFGGVALPGDEEQDEGQGGGLVDAFELSYPEDLIFAQVGQALAPQVPFASDVVTSWTIAPALPAGLEFSSVSGVLSGTPLARAPLTTYRVTATADSGTAEFDLRLDVAGPTRFAYVANAGDDTISIFALDPEDGRPQPFGYHLLSNFEQRPERLLASPDRGLLFAVNEGTDTLSSLSVDAATGRLASADVASIGAGPHSIAVHPNGEFLYVCSETAATLRTLRVDAQTGALEQIGPGLSVADQPSAVLLAPSGRYLVLVHRTGDLSSYTIEQTSGQPLLADELLLFAGTDPRGGAIGPRGDVLYVTLTTFESVVQVAVDPATAALTLGPTRATELDPAPVVLEPRGRFAYVLNQGSDETGTPSVSIYPLDPVTGDLGEPVHQELDQAGLELCFAPDASGAWMLGGLDGPRRYALEETTGALTPGGSARARLDPLALAVVDGDAPARLRARNAYVADGAGDVSAFLVSAVDGTMSSLGPAYAGGGSAAGLAVDPLLRWLWLVNDRPGKESVLTYSVLAEGQLAPIGETLFGIRPTAIAVEPSGRFLYVTTDEVENNVFHFELGADGQPQVHGFQPVGPSPVAVAADPTGRFLYVVAAGTEVPGDQGSISAFAIDPQDGSLSPVLPDGLAGGGPTALALAPDGRRAWAPFANADLISPYTLDLATGQAQLQLVATTTGDRPVDVALSPDGRFAWSAVEEPAGFGRVELYDVRAEDGALYDETSGLLSARATFLAEANPLALAADPDGSGLYVLAGGAPALTRFSVASNDGTLVELDVETTGLSPVALALGVEVD